MNDEKNNGGRRQNINIYICIAATICAVTVIALAVAGSSFSMEDISIPDVSFEMPSMPSVPPAVSDTESDIVSDRPTGGDASDVPGTATKPDNTLTYPVAGGEIAKDYSMDMLVLSQTMRDWRTHSGVDITGNIGDGVFCIADGEVKRVYRDDLYGITVMIDHGEYTSVYMNLGEDIPANVKEGAKLVSGAKIGVIGNSAGCEAADAPHLHFELMKDGTHIDPDILLDKVE